MAQVAELNVVGELTGGWHSFLCAVIAHFWVPPTHANIQCSGSKRDRTLKVVPTDEPASELLKASWQTSAPCHENSAHINELQLFPSGNRIEWRISLSGKCDLSQGGGGAV